MLITRGVSFDHLVGAGEERRRHFDAERLCCLEIDDKLVLGRCLHRQVGGLLTFQDATGIAGGAPKRIDGIRTVRNQAAIVDKEVHVIDRRQSVPSRQRNNQLAMNDGQRVPRHNQAAVRGVRECGDAALSH
jgi:hypothetical protein